MTTTGRHRCAYDVVVVGARAAGAATAMLLARHGARVLVVDRARPGTDTLSTHALMRGGVLQLRRWGLLDAVVAADTPPIRRTTFTMGREQVVVPIKPSHGVDALYAPRRTVLDPLLAAAAGAAGAELRFGVTATDVRRGRRGRVTGLVARDERGRPVDVAADLVVGADGVRSTIAERVHAPVERAGTAATAAVYGYWTGLATDGYEWIFRRGGAAGVIPTNSGQSCVFAAAHPDRIGRGRMAALHAVIADVSPDLAGRLATATPPGGVRTFGGRPGHVRRSWGPGWALVGDAGYWKDPLSAHGLTDALRDAELLVRAVTSAGAGRTADAALREYQAIRDRLSLDLFTVVDTLAAQRATDDELPALLRQLSAAMSDEVEAIAGFDAAPAAA